MAPPKRGLSESSLTTVGEMIENAFGDDDGDNIVDFGFIHAVILILARSLCILDRQVAITLPQTRTIPQYSNITVGEIKVSAKGEKKNKQSKLAKREPTHKSYQIYHFLSQSMFHAPSTTPSEISQESKRKRAISTGPSNRTGTYQEKILVVERRPSTDSEPFNQTPQSLVTKERYKTLMDSVKQLEERFGPFDSELLQALYKSASLSNPMAVLQLSARLEVVETNIKKIMDILISAATAYNLSPRAYDLSPNANNLPNTNKHLSRQMLNIEKSMLLKIIVLTQDEARDLIFSTVDLRNKVSKDTEASKMKKSDIRSSSNHSNADSNLITYEELRSQMKEFAEDITRSFEKLLYQSSLKCETALQVLVTLNSKLSNVFKKLEHLKHLESQTKEFINKVNAIDTKLVDMATKYQEELVSLQFEIDIRIDNMTDAMSKLVPENDAIPELLTKFAHLLQDIVLTNKYQHKLDNLQIMLYRRINVLRLQISELKDVKATREEIEESFKCKIGKCIVGRFTSIEYFNAVLVTWQECMTTYSNVIDGRVTSWQKQIDTMWNTIDKKVTMIQINALIKDINKNVAMLNERLDFLLSLCNFTKVADNRALISSNTKCISCGTTDMDHSELIGTTPEPTDARETNLKAHADSYENEICYQNSPIPNQLDPRADTCMKYCGDYLRRSTDREISEELALCITVRSTNRGATAQVKQQELSLCKQCIFSERKMISSTPSPVKSKKAKNRPKKLIIQANKAQRPARDSIVSKYSLGLERCKRSSLKLKAIGNFSNLDFITREEEILNVVNLDDDDEA